MSSRKYPKPQLHLAHRSPLTWLDLLWQWSIESGLIFPLRVEVSDLLQMAQVSFCFLSKIWYCSILNPNFFSLFFRCRLRPFDSGLLRYSLLISEHRHTLQTEFLPYLAKPM